VIRKEKRSSEGAALVLDLAYEALPIL